MMKNQRNSWKVIGLSLFFLVATTAFGQAQDGIGQKVTRTLTVDSVSFAHNTVVLGGRDYVLPSPESMHAELRQHEGTMSTKEFYEVWLKPGAQVAAVFDTQSSGNDEESLVRLELAR